MTLVSGYSDVVKTPMDFGTMTEKVEKGKYRSLEEFKVSCFFDLVILWPPAVRHKSLPFCMLS